MSVYEFPGRDESVETVITDTDMQKDADAWELLAPREALAAAAAGAAATRLGGKRQRPEAASDQQARPKPSACPKPSGWASSNPARTSYKKKTEGSAGGSEAGPSTLAMRRRKKDADQSDFEITDELPFWMKEEEEEEDEEEEEEEQKVVEEPPVMQTKTKAKARPQSRPKPSGWASSNPAKTSYKKKPEGPAGGV